MRSESGVNTAPIPLPEFDTDWEKGVPYTFGSVTLVIEFLAGETRSKVIEGNRISNVFPVAYGRIQNTTDLHGEEIDFYLASNPNAEGPVFIIDQIEPTTGIFDEHKVMFGFSSFEEVIHAYQLVFSDGSGLSRIGYITVMSAGDFAGWMDADGSSRKPASDLTIGDAKANKVQGIAQIARAPKQLAAPRDEVGGVIVELTDLSRGPKIVTKTLGDGFSYHLYFYSGLKHDVWSNPIDKFCRILDLADEGDEAHIHIGSPGGSVILMGRVISAINRTKAKVITHAEGVVASAATAIWCAGHERHIRPGAYFMQHMSSQMLMGKTTDIQAKSVYCVNYISKRLQGMADTGLFTTEEMRDMIDKSADIYVSGRDAIARMGAVSTRTNR